MAKTIHRKEYAALIETVRDARLAAGLTQVQVSSKLGRSQSFISDVETGKRRVDVVEPVSYTHLTLPTKRIV